MPCNHTQFHIQCLDFRFWNSSCTGNTSRNYKHKAEVELLGMFISSITSFWDVLNEPENPSVWATMTCYGECESARLYHDSVAPWLSGRGLTSPLQGLVISTQQKFFNHWNLENKTRGYKIQFFFLPRPLIKLLSTDPSCPTSHLYFQGREFSQAPELESAGFDLCLKGGAKLAFWSLWSGCGEWLQSLFQSQNLQSQPLLSSFHFRKRKACLERTLEPLKWCWWKGNVP